MNDFAFFSFLWVRHHRVYDGKVIAQTGGFLTDDTGGLKLTDDSGNFILVSDDFSQTVIGNLYRYD